MAAPESVAPARTVRIMTIWQTIRPGWAGAVDPLPRLRRHKVSLPLRWRGVASVTFRLHEPLPLRDIVRSGLNAAAARAPHADAGQRRHRRHRHAAGVPAADRPGRQAAVARRDPADRRAGHRRPGRRPGRGRRRADRRRAPRPAARCCSTRSGPTRGGAPTASVKGTQRLVFGERQSGPTVRSGRLDGIGLDQMSVEMVRRRAFVDVGDLAGYQGDPGQAAAVLVQMAATGAVLKAPDLAPAVSKLLAPELAAILAEPAPDGDDSVALEAHSIRQRRAALRGHASELVLPRLAARRLPAAAAAALGQRHPDDPPAGAARPGARRAGEAVVPRAGDRGRPARLPAAGGAHRLGWRGPRGRCQVVEVPAGRRLRHRRWAS